MHTFICHDHSYMFYIVLINYDDDDKYVYGPVKYWHLLKQYTVPKVLRSKSLVTTAC